MKRLVLPMIPIILIYTLAVLPGCAIEAADRRGRPDRWQPLGDAEAGFEFDRDRLNVARDAGPFRQLRVEVRGAPLEIREMTVTFGDGEQFKPRFPGRLEPGREGYVVDLPGGRRSIDAVTFVYRTEGRRDRSAKVLLYGR
jgi:hypothetical protein